LLSLIGTNVKQLGFAPAQLVQKPVGLSLQVPDFVGPSEEPTGSRNALPSGVKVILNLLPLGVAPMNGWPLKNVALMSLGRIASAASAMPGARAQSKATNRKNMNIVPPAKFSRRNLAQCPTKVPVNKGGRAALFIECRYDPRRPR
jgi:hypothetical protein